MSATSPIFGAGALAIAVLSAMIIADVVTARKLPPNCPVRIFSVIADSSLDELRKSFDLA